MAPRAHASRSSGTRSSAGSGKGRSGGHGSGGHGLPATGTRLEDLGPAGDGEAVEAQVLDLQRAAGNRAVATLVQADRAAPAQAGTAEAAAPAPAPATPARKTSARGSALLDALLADVPGIAAAMSFEQLTAWAAMLEQYDANREVDASLARLERRYLAGRQSTYIADSSYHDKRAAIEDKRTVVDESAGQATLDPMRILAPDVTAQQPYNVLAETQFRGWLVEFFGSRPLVAQLTDRREVVSAMENARNPGLARGGQPHVNLWWGRHTLDHTRGLVTFDDLLAIPDVAKQYRETVTHSPAQLALKQGLSDLSDHIIRMKVEHKDLSDRNRGSGGAVSRTVRGGVRHVSEALGKPSQFQIEAARLRVQANPDDDKARSDLAVLISMTKDYPKLDGEDGIWHQAETELAAAERFARGGMFELAVAALGRAQESAALATERFAGYEKRVMSGAGIAVEWLERAKMAGKVAAAFTGAGGVVRAAAGAAGYTFAQEGLQEVSHHWVDPTHKVDLERVARQSAVDGLMSLFGGLTQGAFVKALSNRFSTRLVTNWNLSPATAEHVLTVAGATTASFYNVPAQIVLDRIIQGKALPKSMAEVADMVVSEAATSAAMEHLGSYVTAGADAPGPDAGKAAPTGEPTPAGPATAAPGQPGQAKQPASTQPPEAIVAGLSGEVARTGPAPAPGRVDPRSSGVATQVPITAEARQLAAQLEPLRQRWAGLSPDARARSLLETIYAPMDETGLPKPRIVGDAIKGGLFEPDYWRIRIDQRLLDAIHPTTEQFADAANVVRHELEHALQWFRMARMEAARSRLSPDKIAENLGIPIMHVEHAIEANTGGRLAEDLSPGSAAAIATQTHFESVYGARSPHRDAILSRLDEAYDLLDRAKARFRMVEHLGPGDVLYRRVLADWHAAYAHNQPIIDAYHALPEEIAAYSVGNELSAAVREHDALARSVDAARTAERRAFAAFEPFQSRVAGLVDKSAAMTAGDRSAFRRAQSQWMDQLRRLRRLEEQLTRLRNPTR